MGIEERIDRLIAEGDGILKALETLNDRVAEIARRFSPTVVVVENEPPLAKPKRWRILEVGEMILDGDLVNAKTYLPSDPPHGLGWRPVGATVGMKAESRDGCIFAREVTDDANQSDQSADAGEKVEEEPVEEPTVKESLTVEPEPWSPKVGDWVKVTRPDDWIDWDSPYWLGSMHQFNEKVFAVSGKVFAVSGKDECGYWFLDGAYGFVFDPSWLSPAEPPSPPEQEYREPVLPMDAGEQCEFSDDEKDWCQSELISWRLALHCWQCHSGRWWRFARIRKDA